MATTDRHAGGLSAPRRTVLLSIGAVTVAMAVIAAGLGLRMLQYYRAESQATARATATVTAAGLGADGTEVEVDWTDATGGRHVARIELYEPAFPVGASYELRYNPSEPDGEVFPAALVDDVTYRRVHDYQIPLGLAVALYLAALAAWAVRGVLNRRAGRQPGSPWRVVALLGVVQQQAYLPAVQLVPAGTEIVVDPLTHDEPVRYPGSRWQRVMWDPAIETVLPGQPATVSIHGRLLRRAVVRLADGSVLYPAGRLRKRPWFMIALQYRPELARRHLRALAERARAGDGAAKAELIASIRRDLDLDETIPVDPLDPDFAIEPPRPFRPPLVKVLLVAIFGGVIGWFSTQNIATVVAIAAAGVGLGLYVWTFNGGDPERL